MMSIFAIRAITLAIVVVLLARQVVKAAPGSYRRRAFSYATGGFGLFGLLNGMLALGIDPGSASWTLIAIALLLVTGSLVMLVRAYQSGELKQQFERARQVVEQERERVAERRMRDEQKGEREG